MNAFITMIQLILSAAAAVSARRFSHKAEILPLVTVITLFLIYLQRAWKA